MTRKCDCNRVGFLRHEAACPTRAGLCQESIYQPRMARGYPCPNRALPDSRYSRYCGVHDPERKAARAAKRGPSRFECEQAAIRARYARQRAAEKVVDAARAVIGAATKTTVGVPGLAKLQKALADYDELAS